MTEKEIKAAAESLKATFRQKEPDMDEPSRATLESGIDVIAAIAAAIIGIDTSLKIISTAPALGLPDRN